ncbi:MULTISPECIES: hypothetical protein [unclassified Streptomyces]|uniref:hypothetical protein n=1 Tax=unclassified Streptomyces TaxID=2593676 RepID=UPI0006F6A44D|nr:MULTISPECIES: hypothetical protein [unclassified Streptomyces]KQX53152.1 hypothetical protein ASD33_08070 [Streptomyces sp. Root1304]KRA90073.1 hypothetical protein ASE09_08075 [Streptomyces sp. Root66D1]
MRKVMGAAVAAGVMLLVAGCGSDGGTDKGGSASGGSSSAGSSSTGGSGGSGGERLDGAAVTAELSGAATGAGFTQDASGEQVPPTLKDCMVSWTADAEKAADPAKAYDATVATLTKGGWNEERSSGQGGSVIKSLKKSTWQLQASNHSAGPLKLVMFVAVDSGPECAAAIAEENAKAKKS